MANQQLHRLSSSANASSYSEFGSSYWIRHLCMHTSMDLFCFVLTESCGGCSPEYFVTWRIILRSKCMAFSVCLSHESYFQFIRMLLACLHFLAECPCPRCYIKKRYMSAMGTTADLYRRAKIRVDNEDIQRKIKLTRGWIFEQGRGAGSAAINRVLEGQSLLPNCVRPH